MPKWIGEIPDVVHPGAASYETFGGIGEPRTFSVPMSRRDPGPVAKAVCMKCNNGWMSQLEERTKEVFYRLLDTSQDGWQLDVDQKSTLASWAVKTCILFDYTGFYSVRCWPSKYAADLFNGEMPSKARVWLVCLDEENDRFTLQRVRMRFSETGLQLPNSVTGHVNFWRTLLMVLRIGIVVEVDDSTAGPFPAPGPPNGRIQLWPTSGDDSIDQWPPGSAMPRNSFMNFYRPMAENHRRQLAGPLILPRLHVPGVQERSRYLR